MLAHDWRLHDALAVDDRAKPAGPGSVDQRTRVRATIEWGVVADVEVPVIGDHNAHGGVELPEAARANGKNR